MLSALQQRNRPRDRFRSELAALLLLAIPVVLSELAGWPCQSWIPSWSVA